MDSRLRGNDRIGFQIIKFVKIKRFPFVQLTFVVDEEKVSDSKFNNGFGGIAGNTVSIV